MIKKIFIAVAALFVFTGQTSAQYNRIFGAEADATGGAGVVLTDIWASSHNQAGLAHLDGMSAGVYFSNAFGVADMGTKAFAFAIPADKYGTVGVNYTYFGNELFNDSKFALNYSKKLGKRISAGIQLDYFLTVQGLDYGKQGVVAGEIGLLSEPVDNLFIGVHLFNPWGAAFAQTPDESVLTMLRIGAGYKFSDRLVLRMDVDKDIDFPAVFRIGFDYELVDNLHLRAGVSTNPTQFSFGTAYGLKGFMFDLSFTKHQILGYYSQFALSYTLNKKDEK